MPETKMVLPTQKATHITPDQILELREKLLDKREELTGEVENLHQDAASSTESTSNSKSPLNIADNASDAFEQDFAFLSIESEEKLLSKVEYALYLIQAGTYGLCDECEVAIPVERLEFMAWADLCIACQTKEERGDLVRERDEDFELLADAPDPNATDDD